MNDDRLFNFEPKPKVPVPPRFSHHHNIVKLCRVTGKFQFQKVSPFKFPSNLVWRRVVTVVRAYAVWKNEFLVQPGWEAEYIIHQRRTSWPRTLTGTRNRPQVLSETPTRSGSLTVSRHSTVTRGHDWEAPMRHAGIRIS